MGDPQYISSGPGGGLIMCSSYIHMRPIPNFELKRGWLIVHCGLTIHSLQYLRAKDQDKSVC